VVVRAEVIGDDISAWIEVETAEYGWVPIDVTPDRSREPVEEQLGITIKDVAVPNPPPPPPPAPDELTTPPLGDEDELDDDAADDTEADRSVPVALAVLGLSAGLGLAGVIVVAVVGAAVMLLKRGRTSRRRTSEPASAIAGAWNEIIDRYADAGVEFAEQRTPRESVASFLRDQPAAARSADDLRRLADSVDRSAFHPQPAGPEDAAAAWIHCDQAIIQLSVGRSRTERWWMASNPSTLVAGRRSPARGSASRRSATKRPNSTSHDRQRSKESIR